MLRAEQEDEVITLKAQIASLQNRVKELEAENAKLSFRILTCRCNDIEEKLDGSALHCTATDSVEAIGEIDKGDDRNRKKKTTAKMPSPGYDTSIMNHHPRRYVALKVMYFGQRFYGFASEAQMDPTVEAEIFKALEKTRLLIGNKKEVWYSRCGRTDKGVSAVGQVIALLLRSKLKDIDANNKNSGGADSESQNGSAV